MDNVISVYMDVVEALKFMGGRDNLNELIKEKLGAESTGPLVFRIRNEILRQNRPSKRCLQINEWLPKVDPEPCIFGEDCHYLDELSASFFKSLFEGYGSRYTIGVEDRVVEFIRKNKKNILNVHQNKEVQVVPIAIHERIYRKEERMHLGIRLWVDEARGDTSSQSFYHKNNLLHAQEAVSQNISVSGLKLKHVDKGVVGGIYAIRFSGWEKDFVMQDNAILYQLIKVDENKGDRDFGFSWFLKIVENIHHGSFLTFLSNQIHSNRGRYKVDIDNIERSTTNQIAEQFLTNRNEGFSLFFDHADRASFVFGSLLGQAEYERFKHGEGSCLYPLIEKYKTALLTPNATSFICGFRQKNGVHFAAVLEKGNALHIAFCTYAKGMPGAYFFQVNSVHAQLRDAFLSHNLPNDVTERSHSLKVRYKGGFYGRDTQDEVSKLNRVLVFKPLSIDLLVSMVAGNGMLGNDKLIPEFKHFAILQAKPNPPPFIRAKSKEMRREDRFVIKTNFEIKSLSCKGVTVDISASGVSVLVKEGRIPSLGSIVSVEFSDLQEVESFPPVASYKVMDVDGLKVRLCGDINGQLSERRFVSAYLSHNIDSIIPVSEQSEAAGVMVGLERALRNLSTYSQYGIGALVRVKNARAVVSHLCLPKEKSQTLFDEHSKTYEPCDLLKKVFCNLELQDYMSEQLRRISKENPFSNAIVALLYQKNKGGKISIHGAKVFDKPFSSTSQHETLTRLAKKKNIVVEWFHLSLTRKSRVFDRYYRDELFYIEKLSPHRAEPLIDMASKTTGIMQLHPLGAWVEHCSFDDVGVHFSPEQRRA